MMLGQTYRAHPHFVTTTKGWWGQQLMELSSYQSGNPPAEPHQAMDFLQGRGTQQMALDRSAALAPNAEQPGSNQSRLSLSWMSSFALRRWVQRCCIDLAAAVASPEAVSQTDPDPSVSRHSSEIRRLTWHLAAVWCAAQKNVEQIGADSLCHCIQRITGWMQNNLQQPNAIQTFVREFRRCP